MAWPMQRAARPEARVFKHKGCGRGVANQVTDALHNMQSVVAYAHPAGCKNTLPILQPSWPSHLIALVTLAPPTIPNTQDS